jgi:L-fuconolactonase
MNRRTFLSACAASAAGLAAGDSRATAPLPLVDSHVHFWDSAHLKYPWIAAHPVLNRAYLPADYFASAASHAVEKVVFVEAACLPGQALGEVAWVEGLAADHPRIAAIVAHAPLELGAPVEPTLAWLAERPLVRGVRRLLQGEPGTAFGLRDEYVAGARLLGKHGLLCELGVRRDQLAAARELVARCPDTRFVLNHLGGPDLRGGGLEPWRTDLAALAAMPNAWCKLSGAATAADHAAWRVEDLRPAVDHVLQVFGPERVLFGSDWPVLRLAAEFPRWAEAARELVSPHGPGAVRAVFRDTATALYRL